MSNKQYQLWFIISYLNILNAVSVSMKSLSPSTLHLPSGFDSQLPPRQPMLYPFAVSLSADSTRTPIKNIPVVLPGWVPMSSQTKSVIPPLLPPESFSSSTTTTTPSPIPLHAADTITQYEAPPLASSNNDGPVFESIVYGTWKPDPPLQPAEILNTTKQLQQSNGLLVDGGKVYNKTINRQHGGFIGNIEQKIPKNDRHNNVLKNSNERSTTSSSIEYRSSNESIELNLEQKQRKIKKQGRQKIRPNTSATTQKSIIESGLQRSGTEQTTQSQQTVIKVDAGDPQLMEVVKQINDSIEIKYNHKQTSAHSIEMTTASDNDHHHNHHHRYVGDYDDDDGDDEQQRHPNSKEVSSSMPAVVATVTTSSTELQQQNDEEELENTSVTRMNWPTDFMMNTPQSSTSPTIVQQPSQQSNEGGLFVTSASTSSSSSIETESFELPLALSALNIPPSLWPKLPGNITKFGSPYEAENSAEEPALCVPITVREHNMINSNEIVHIERVFCFPMPQTTTRINLKNTRRIDSTTLSTIMKAKVQNYDSFPDINVRNKANTLVQCQMYYLLLSYVLAIYLKIIY